MTKIVKPLIKMVEDTMDMVSDIAGSILGVSKKARTDTSEPAPEQTDESKKEPEGEEKGE